MPTRLLIAYGLIALMLAAAAILLAISMRNRRDQRHVSRGGRPGARRSAAARARAQGRT